MACHCFLDRTGSAHEMNQVQLSVFALFCLRKIVRRLMGAAQLHFLHTDYPVLNHFRSRFLDQMLMTKHYWGSQCALG